MKPAGSNARMKAQVWTADFIISVIIFFTMVVLMIFSWNYTNQQNTYQQYFNDIENNALSVSDALIRVPGIPEDWNETNVISLGLASSDNVLGRTKITRFINLANDKTKNLLGIGNFEFYFELRYLNNTAIPLNSTANITKGLYPFANASIIVPVERYVLYESTPSKMEFFLWSP